MTDHDPTVSPDAKRSKISLRLKKLATPPKTDNQELSDHRSHTAADGNTSRFVSPSKSLESYQRGFEPKNTEVNTQWAACNFEEQRTDYNSHHPEQPCPEDVLLTDSLSELSFWLQKYVLGTCIRKKASEQYPPKSVHLLLCGIHRYMKEKKLNAFNIFDRENPEFKLLFNTCDSYFRELREDGIGSDSKGTEPVTRDDGERLWSTGVLSVSTPKGLLYTVFFL